MGQIRIDMDLIFWCVCGYEIVIITNTEVNTLLTTSDHIKQFLDLCQKWLI